MSFRNFKRDNLRIQKTQNLEKIRVSPRDYQTHKRQKIKEKQVYYLDLGFCFVGCGICLFTCTDRKSK